MSGPRSHERRVSARRAPAGAPSAPGNCLEVGRGVWERPKRKVGLSLFVIAALAFLAVIATNLASLTLDHLRTSLLNANWEFSWSHDADTIALAVGTCAAASVVRRPGSRRGLWAVTAAILALLVLDELSPVHGQLRNFGKLLYAPVLAALVVALWRLTARTTERRFVFWGVATLLVSFGMHVVGLHVLRPIGYLNWLYQTGVGFKEGTELAGLILLVAALWMLAADQRAAPTSVRRQRPPAARIQ